VRVADVSDQSPRRLPLEKVAGGKALRTQNSAMSSLSNRDARQQAGQVEVAHFSGEFSHPQPPPPLPPNPAAFEWIGHHRVEMPRLDQLVEERAPGSALRAFRFLDKMGRRSKPDGSPRRGAWVRTSTIAKETDQAESTVRTVAIPWLVANGWLSPRDLQIQGEDRVMFWCLWLLPHDLAGEECHLGQGLKIRGEGREIVPAREPRRRRTADRTARLISTEGAAACAQPAAPNSSNEFKTERVVNVNAAPPGGGGSKTLDPSPVADPPPRKPDPPEECLALLAAAPIRFPILMAGPLWDLVDQGVPLPGPWARVKMPPRPGPEAAAPPARPRPSAPPKAPTTVDLLHRLADPCGPESRAARVRELSRKFADSLDDPGSVNFYARILGRAAAGEIKLKPIIAAYRAAKGSATARRKGAIFTDKLKELTGGPP